MLLVMLLHKSGMLYQWYKLDQRDIDCGSINGFKNRLKGIRKTKIGFFMD